MRQLAFFLAFMVASPALLGADVYRWKDANGVINYTQQRPQGFEAELISASGQVRSNRASSTTVETVPAPSAAAPLAADGGELNAEQQKMLDDLKLAEQERQEAFLAAKNDNCERARGLLQQLSARGRIRVTGADGEQKILPEEERQQRISEAQQGVAENCD